MHVNSRLLTLMQFLFSFDQVMKIEETLMQVNSRLLTLMQFLFSFDQAMKIMRKVSCKLSSFNSHAIKQ